MKLKPIEDGNSDFSLVELRDDGNIGRLTPHCKIHGAMLKVSPYFWRCVQADYYWADKTGGHREVNDCRAGCVEVEK